MDRIKWTDEESDLLREKFAATPIKELEQMFPGRNRNAIYSRAKKLGLQRDENIFVARRKRGSTITDEQRETLRRSHTEWTQEQEELLAKLYPTAKSEDLTAVFPGFTAQQIALRANQIGLSKDYEFFVQTGLEGAAAKWDESREYKDKEGKGENWRDMQRKSRSRASQRCEWCGIGESEIGYRLSVHHIVPFHAFGYIPNENDNYIQANRLSNLVCVCKACHIEIEGKRGVSNRRDALDYFASHSRSATSVPYSGQNP